MVAGRSLKFKFLVAIFLTTTVALFVSCSAMIIYNLHDYRESVTKDLTAQAAILGRSITPALQFDDPASAEVYLKLLEHRPDVIEAAIYNERGQLFASYRPDLGQSTGAAKVPEVDGSWVDGNSLVVYQRVIFDDQIQGFVFVRMHYDLIEKLIGNLMIAAASVLISVLVVFLLSHYLHKNVIGPILSLSQLSRKLADSKDYSLRAEKTSRDEIGYLVDAFNDMLDEVVAGKQQMEIANKELTLEIQERKDAEAALKESEENVLKLNAELEQRVQIRTMQLEIANQELESFSYSVSHDLRSPLRAIDGFSQALVEDYKVQLDERGADYLRRVRAAAQKMGILIDDLLKLARVSRADMRFQKVNLSELVEDVVADISGQDPDRSVKVTVTSGLTATCDPHLIRVALTNLINNSWKYTAKTDAPKIEFGLRICKSGPAFFIQDNGVGFNMEYADKLFGAFQRMHSATEFPGTGVGLATVKRVISRHGGIVWAEAEEGKGATFYFTLPNDDRPLGE